ncbi:hypothetical protein [Motiliproteus sp. SC1-56]|uniref:hypothetical protein n=1 Tax=Motiliproteus sp. SC1-56 TaxID=2799565 RepID=UPI001A8C1F77|nr:hypothetical protein [Motiliproteus sp. SC1-56]
MIVENSQIQLSGEHQKTERHQQSTSLEAFVVELDAARSGTKGSATPQLNGALTEAGIDPSRLARAQEGAGLLRNEAPGRGADTGALDTPAKLFLALLEALTGRCTGNMQKDEVPPVAGLRPKEPGEGEAEKPQRALRVELHLHQMTAEYERSQFAVQGRVQTADGQQLALDFSLTMSRSYRSETHLALNQALTFKDPLVLNFDGQAAELSDERYRFDLDADGEVEWLSRLSGNSAFLALDHNGDGIINDGRELFGALSGNGFADLAAYDEDGNGWIDEADSVFEQLRLWRQDGETEPLQSLAEGQVGALYLGATDTPFALKGDDNRTLGEVRQSGIYLNEDGRPGSLQQIDLAV